MDEIMRLFEEGKRLMQQQKWGDAADLFERILQMNPSPEIEKEANELAYDCFLMLSDDMPVQSIAIPALSRWHTTKTPEERRAIIAEATTATSAYIEERLKEFEQEIDEVIAVAVKEYEEHPERREELLKRVLEEINRILGPGCLGPATAAAAPLADRKRQETARLFDTPGY